MEECQRYHSSENKTRDTPRAAQIYVDVVNDRKTWDNLNRVTILTVEEEVFNKYLFKWGRMNRCFPMKERKVCYKLLLETIRNEADTIESLRETHIDRVSLDSGPSREKIELLYQEFRDFCCNAAKKQPTASAKILHILLPQIFMIWDWKYVRNPLRFGTDSPSYVRYLRRGQSQLRDLLGSYHQLDASADLAKLIQAAEAEHDRFLTQELGLKQPAHEPITKLLDEYQVMTSA